MKKKEIVKAIREMLSNDDKNIGVLASLHIAKSAEIIESMVEVENMPPKPRWRIGDYVVRKAESHGFRIMKIANMDFVD